MLEFVETIDSEKFGSFIVVLQEYEDEYEQSIYNVGIECNNGLYSNTLDIYESTSIHNAKEYYDNLIKNIEKTNNL